MTVPPQSDAQAVAWDVHVPPLPPPTPPSPPLAARRREPHVAAEHEDARDRGRRAAPHHPREAGERRRVRAREEAPAGRRAEDAVKRGASCIVEVHRASESNACTIHGPRDCRHAVAARSSERPGDWAFNLATGDMQWDSARKPRVRSEKELRLSKKAASRAQSCGPLVSAGRPAELTCVAPRGRVARA